MTADIHQNFQGGTPGASIVTGSSTLGNTALTSVGTAPVITTADAISGTQSADCVAAAGLQSAALLPYVPSGTAFGSSCYFRLKGALSSLLVDESFFVARIGGANRVFAKLQASTGKLVLNDATSGDYVSTVALAAETTYRLELLVDSGTSSTDGKEKFRVTRPSDGAVIIDWVERTGRNAGAGGALANVYAGCMTVTGTGARRMVVDEIYMTDSYASPSMSTAANTPPTVTAGATVTMSSGTTATITVQGNDTDGTISSFTPSVLTNSMTTTPTFGTQAVTNPGTANASSSIPVANLSPGDLSVSVIDTDNSGAVSATPAVCRIVYTSTSPKVRSVTLNGVTMTSPTSGTPKDALNAWLTNPATVAPPVFTATSSPPAAGAGVIVAYQPLDPALISPNFGHYWASDGSTALTVYVDLKFGGVTRATKSLTITSATAVFVGRDTTDAENTAIGSDRSLPSVESRFA